MIFVKSGASLLSLYVAIVIYSQLACGLPRDKRSPQLGLSPLLNAGQSNRNIWASVGRVNLSGTEQKSTSIFGKPNAHSTSVQNQQIPHSFQDNGHINQNLGSATPVSPNAFSAVPTENDQKNQRALLGLGSQPLLGAGVNNENTWLSVAGQNVVLTQTNKKQQQHTVNPVQHSGQPNSVTKIPSTLSQQTGLKPQPEGSVESNDDDASTSIDSRFPEQSTTQAPTIVNYDPNMFQVQPVRPANEIV